MDEDSLKNSFARELLRLLNETCEQAQRYFLDTGGSLLETIDKVSAAEASRPMSTGGGCIAAQVDHVCYFMRVLESEIRKTDFGEVDWQESWGLTEVTTEEWEAQKERLRQTCQSVSSAIRDVDRWDGEVDIGAPLVILAHTAYHLGAIRQMLHNDG